MLVAQAHLQNACILLSNRDFPPTHRLSEEKSEDILTCVELTHANGGQGQMCAY
ncbi:hypothetical protein B0H17DRAFT_1058200 [Mycena rosella]|uniref:Uncharacterized protein n=1 Tax=Mycena rosella TaxID=1033263 RepID=A0AAD7DL18_MYCRO|nr:hypothetical protein B0H17DRAFT_1058200 [Mycena rosella]